MKADRFAGFSGAGLRFLRDLAERNEREWFNAHKDTYLTEIDAPLRSLAADLAARFARARVPLAPNPRNPVMRIYRDLRFTPDKRPYKTHASFAFRRDGDPEGEGVAYVHIHPKDPFVEAGFYAPKRDALHVLRAAVVADPRRFLRLAAELEAAGLPLLLDDALVRLPAGFRDAGTAIERYVKLTSFVVRRDLRTAQLREATLVDDLTRFVSDARPLFDWDWNVLGP